MKIFVSHSSADNTIVEKAVEVIKKYQIEYWVDFEQIEEGDPPTAKINEGLCDTTHFFLIWSQEAKDSGWVKEETDIIMSPGYKDKVKRILFILEELEPPYGFAMYQHWIDNEKVNSEVRDVIKNILQVDTDIIEEFDEYLDENFEEIKLDDSVYAFSTVLKRTDKAKYRIMLHQFIEQKIQRLEEEENES